jgi:hypothetical protein
MADLQARLMCGISRSATVVLSRQINRSLQAYFAPSELLVVVLAGHALIQTLPSKLEGFNVSWGTFRGVMQSLSIQLLVSYLTQGQKKDLAFFNLVGALLVSECLQVNCLSEDVTGFATSVSYIISDQLSTVIASPVMGAALGLFFGGDGLLGQTLVLTGVNSLCSVAFGAVRAASSLSLVWPVVLLYFVHEAVRRFQKAQALLDYGLYKASDSVYQGLSSRLRPDVLALLFFLLLVVAPMKDEVWMGVCALALVQATSDWFLSNVAQEIQSDAFLGALCVVTVVHFSTAAIERLNGGKK